MERGRYHQGGDKGERPDGRILAPIMPYHNNAALTEADDKELVAFIKSLKPIMGLL